ncbi:MAG: hypothetical protein LBC27_10365 [Spirochaetaceae bacterium]|jgi:hypothetical protein|nr:hypothetical protein [Spirochaetaceae bacterium]
MMKKKRLAIAASLAAVLCLAASCGGDTDIGDLIQSSDTLVKTTGVFALFNAPKSDQLSQQVDLVYSSASYSPVLQFSEEGTDEESWLITHGLAEYNFVDDPYGYGPKWTNEGGGGDAA